METTACKLEGLDAFRGVAALVVLLHHATGKIELPQHYSTRLFWGFFAEGQQFAAGMLVCAWTLWHGLSASAVRAAVWVGGGLLFLAAARERITDTSSDPFGLRYAACAALRPGDHLPEQRRRPARRAPAARSL